MAKKKGPSWFKLYGWQEDMFQEAPDKNVAEAFRMALAYFNRHELPEQNVEPLSAVLFRSLKSSIDDAWDSYAVYAENGKKGGRAKGTTGPSRKADSTVVEISSWQQPDSM